MSLPPSLVSSCTGSDVMKGLLAGAFSTWRTPAAARSMSTARCCSFQVAPSLPLIRSDQGGQGCTLFELTICLSTCMLCPLPHPPAALHLSSIASVYSFSHLDSSCCAPVKSSKGKRRAAAARWWLFPLILPLQAVIGPTHIDQPSPSLSPPRSPTPCPRLPTLGFM